MLICQDFFTAGEIVKQNTIEKGMKNLRSVIGFYRDTTGRTELGCHDMVEMTIILVTYPAISLSSLSLSLSSCLSLIEMLITGFMKEETTHCPTSDGSCGEVMLEVDAYAHTTKLDGTVRGIYDIRCIFR